MAWVADVPDPASPRAARAPTSSGSPHCASAPRPTAPARPCIADADGRLLEGAFTSLLWWEGETLCAVPDDAPILPGITRALLHRARGRRDTPVAQRRPAPEELAGRETWLVSALHGIRAVTRWAAAVCRRARRRARAPGSACSTGSRHRQGV